MARFQFHNQETNYTCGAASMRMALEYFNIKKPEKLIARWLRTNKMRGTWHKCFPLVAEKFRFNHISMRNATIDDLKEYHKKGFIIIICYWCPSDKVDHYSVMKKIGKSHIYFWDPFFGQEHKRTLTDFKKIWKSDLKYDNEKNWFFAMKK